MALAQKSYTLIDYTKAPAKTFWLPEDPVRKNLKLGMQVQLVFESNQPDMGGERMWVKVTHIGPDGYTGLLQNEPIDDFGELHHGSEVTFSWFHVINVHTAEPEVPTEEEEEGTTLSFREVWIYAAAIGLCDGVDGAEYQRALQERGITGDAIVCSKHGCQGDCVEVPNA